MYDCAKKIWLWLSQDPVQKLCDIFVSSFLTFLGKKCMSKIFGDDRFPDTKNLQKKKINIWWHFGGLHIILTVINKCNAPRFWNYFDNIFCWRLMCKEKDGWIFMWPFFLVLCDFLRVTFRYYFVALFAKTYMLISLLIFFLIAF